MLIINPGSGPVYGSVFENARSNIDQLIIDAGLDPKKMFISREKNSNIEVNGRYLFILEYLGIECSVAMPGLPLSDVRYTREKGQNIFDYPRLYVDGSSWVWYFAVGIVKSRFLREEL